MINSQPCKGLVFAKVPLSTMDTLTWAPQAPSHITSFNTYIVFQLVFANMPIQISMVSHIYYFWMFDQSEMTLNYRVIVEKYQFLNEVVGGSIPAVKSSLYLMGKNS